MSSYEAIKRGIIKRIRAIGNDLSKQNFDGELEDLLMCYERLV
ncbi:hypothetical protein [Anaerovorax sp. IOR16]|nr:hypothetical protein [Anaerovorax sp. IOR16]